MIKRVGAILGNNGCCRFTVWAPEKETMILHIIKPEEKRIQMKKDKEGYFSVEIEDIKLGYQYYYIPDGEKGYPDPASFYQPEGVHGPSEIVMLDYEWHDADWRNIPLKDFIIYELHMGTFTEVGTFDAAIARLDDLAATGINAIEIMPISQFPGERNWGYDGVFPYAAQNSYGGYAGLRRLVDACHNKGIAVILDVVYNHLGPEGNCLPAYAPFFTDKYGTPWGQAINYDGPWSDGVRNYFCNNALYWLKYFHIDALRLDAIHEMYDFGAYHFWEFLHDNVVALCQEEGRHFYLIAESDLNNPKIIKSIEAGGYGFSAQWLDDFHHSLTTLMDGQAIDRYKDFGAIEQLAKAYTDGFVHSGEYVMARNKKYGRSSAGLSGEKFIVFNQNHDQVGNTADGGRLTSRINDSQLMIAAAALLLSPYIPMLFMGEEYGEDAPFSYFIDHGDEQLIDAVRKGRRKEFEKDNWNSEPADPKSEATFLASKLKWEKRYSGRNATLLNWNKQLIALRKTNAAIKNFNKNYVRVYIITDKCYALHRQSDDQSTGLLAIFNMGNDIVTYAAPKFAIGWLKILDNSSFQQAAGDKVPLMLDGQSLGITAQSVVVYSNAE